MEHSMSINEFKGHPRLPKFVIPRAYHLHLKPDLTVSTFFGALDIIISIIQNTNFIVLNSLDLIIHKACFTNSQAQQFYPYEVVLDSDDEILVLVFNEELCISEGVLRIEFSGILNEHLKGFYKCTYTDGREKKYMAVTQFEAVDARRCFPCWDEPSLKATFKITVDVPLELTALSNMPVIDEKLNGNVKSIYFEETPIMSTYLVAIVIGLFDHVEDVTADGTKVCVYCPVGKSDKGKFALDVAIKALNLYTKYFSMPYPLPKLDMVAVPEFSGGAMENYGLIIYRENEMLYDELLSTAARKQILTIVVTHEVAHQWFGNLVTMEWWTHLWLNEGFATWISYMATDILFPEWKIWTQFLEQTTGGLCLDAQQQSHPIEVDVHHARSVDQIFDAISYKKGSAIIRMLQGYLGDDVFQKSLRSYMKRYASKNAKTEDLWSVFSEESGVKINSMMDDWTKKKGYPVISVKSRDHILVFEQSQFLTSGSNGVGQWIVPITLSLGSYSRCNNFLLETKIKELDLSELLSPVNNDSSSCKESNIEISDENIWIKVNVEQSGFYRVKYEAKLAAKLREAIENNFLSATDKYGILDDTYALCEACEESLSSLLSLMDVYRKELEYIVVSKLINVCNNVLKIATDVIPDSLNELKQFFINLLLFSAEKLGWESEHGESHIDSLLRGEILIALATFDHEQTHKEANRRFHALLKDKNTPLLSADTRRAAYIAVMRNANTTNRNGFESVLQVYREVDVLQEKERILRSLASCSDEDIVKEVLDFLLSDEVRDQDIIYGLGGISLEGRETAWRWLKENWEQILTRYGAGILLTHFITRIVATFCSEDKADEIEVFFRSRVNPSIAMTLKQSIEQIRIKARWAQHIKQDKSLHNLIKQLALLGD